MLSAAVVAIAMVLVALLALARPALIARLDQGLVALGFEVADIDIRGNRYTTGSDVRAALALAAPRSHLTLPLAPLARAIEALPWVSTAHIERRLPGGLIIHIAERPPAAVWRSTDRDVLIDAHGRTLSQIPRGSDTGLRVLAGEGAAAAAPTLLRLLETHHEIDRRLVEARRIDRRRWTLVLSGGTHVQLPADGVAGAMAWLDAQGATGLLDRRLAAIDLRVQGELIVRTGQPAAAPLGAKASGWGADPASGG